jgi:transmembrane sensor
MSSSYGDAPERGEGMIRDLAARWVVRQDRRLTAAEAEELHAWLAADPRHAAALAAAQTSWRTFRELGSIVRHAPEPVIVPSVRTRIHWGVIVGLAAAVVVLALIAVDRPRRVTAPAAIRGAAPAVLNAPATRRLADGSVARLKNDAKIVESFTPNERRVRLVRGEAFFTVAKDAARPFFVEVGEVTVRAVGTAFAVQLESRAVNVLVTEGTVRVTPATPVNKTADEASALVDAGHRAVVARENAASVAVTAVSVDEMARALAWNVPMLDLAGATLGELVRAFSAQAGRRVEIGDPALAEVRIGGRFPTEDVEGFVRVLEEIYDVKSERRADGAIVLRKAR